MGIIAIGNFVYRGIPKKLVLDLKNALSLNVFIETGTYMGDTAIWASDHFDNVITIEASEEIYKSQNKKYGIKYILGDSSNLLKQIISENSLIYLDAHYSGGTTFNTYPLIEELNGINSSELENLSIIVDDARFCNSLWNDEKYGDLVEIVNLLSF